MATVRLSFGRGGSSPSGRVSSSAIDLPFRRGLRDEAAPRGRRLASASVRYAAIRVRRESRVRLQAAEKVECVVELLVVLRLRRNVGVRPRALIAGAFTGEMALEARLAL